MDKMVLQKLKWFCKNTEISSKKQINGSCSTVHVFNFSLLLLALFCWQKPLNLLYKHFIRAKTGRSKFLIVTVFIACKAQSIIHFSLLTLPRFWRESKNRKGFLLFLFGCGDERKKTERKRKN